MFIAQEKYKSNIVEYLLYMFHIEDVIRANHFSMTELERNIISKYNLDEEGHEKVKAWYEQLIHQMEKDDVQKAGHMSSLKELIFQLNDLHIELLNTAEEERYLEHYHWSSDYIKELKDKMHHEELTEIEVCLNGLYAFMLMKMKGMEVTEETTEALSVFTQMLRYLSKKYHQRVSQV